MRDFWLCFIPLFVAVDAVGILPMYISITSGVENHKLPHLLRYSLITAVIVGIAFIVSGKFIFNLLGISVSDFLIAGGLLLFIISIADILSINKMHKRIDPESLGGVPIAVPLIVGPAVLTTAIVLADQFGFFITSVALTINIIIAGIILYFSPFINKVLGNSGAKIVSKIASLLLAAIAIMMIRKGIEDFLIKFLW